MTVRVTQKMRKRISAIKKELVTDHSYKDINKRGFIYETPDNGKTIYRRPTPHYSVSGVKIGDPQQLELNFNKIEDDIDESVEKNPGEHISKRIILAKISQIYVLIGEITEEVKRLRDTN